MRGKRTKRCRNWRAQQAVLVQGGYEWQISETKTGTVGGLKLLIHGITDEKRAIEIVLKRLRKQNKRPSGLTAKRVTITKGMIIDLYGGPSDPLVSSTIEVISV